MSKRNSHTDFVPVLWEIYESPKFEGVIVEVAERKVAKSTGKEYISFQVAITEVYEETAKEVGDLVWQMACPKHKLNGQFNTMRNAK
jgi:hypothetical protein